MTNQLIMPKIGLGTWKLKGEECESTVKSALEIGYRHIDTADTYENHQAIGKVIHVVPRDQLFLTTKLSMKKLLPSEVKTSILRFLEELNVGYLDLLLIHWPNPDVNMVETLKTMLSFKEKGIIRNLGISNFVRSHLKSLTPLHFPILTNQIELHPYLQRKELVKCCREMNIGITAYRPLAKGAFEQDPALQKMGFKYKKTPSQVVLRWLIEQGFTAIPKASSIEHLQDNIEIFDFSLEEEDKKTIDAMDSGKRYCAPEGFPLFED